MVPMGKHLVQAKLFVYALQCLTANDMYPWRIKQHDQYITMVSFARHCAVYVYRWLASVKVCVCVWYVCVSICVIDIGSEA